MAKRKGIFVGAYVHPEIAARVEKRAKAQHTTKSRVIAQILSDALLVMPVRVDKTVAGKVNSDARKAVKPVSRSKDFKK
jgi:hypothetical protein